jgi:hypothetical protein
MCWLKFKKETCVTMGLFAYFIFYKAFKFLGYNPGGYPA